MESLLNKIKNIYGLDLDLQEKVTEGFLSENYILHDESSKHFLKKYRFTDAERIQEIHRVKKYFSEGGIPVILPISGKNLETFFEHRGGFYAMFPFIRDRQLPWDQLDEKAITSYAHMLARIHLCGKESAVAVRERYRPWDSTATLQQIAQILEISAAIPQKTDFDVQAQALLLLKKEIIESNRKAYDTFGLSNDHLIHGDYIVPNVFFDADNNVSFVFDWEKTEYSPRFLELFRSMIQCTMFDPTHSKTYLAAYLELYPASKEELWNGINAYRLEQTHSLWIEEEHYLKGNYRTDNLLDSNSQRIKCFAEGFEDFKHAIIDSLCAH